MTIAIDVSILELFLPKGTMDWFDIVESKNTDNEVCIILEEKNIPPLLPEQKDKKITSKGFYSITITDFPIRGKRTSLTFRRRRWRVEGQQELLKRDIQLCAPGTQLEKEFASFLKEQSGEVRHLFDEYC